MLLSVVAGYRDDFRADGPLVPGWHYLWNAPAGWVGGGSSGDMTTAPLGDVATFRPLADAGANWTPDGNLDANHSPDGHLRLHATGGHPGQASGQVFGNSHDRYAVAAYTVSRSGLYALTDSTMTVPAATGDGVEVIVSVNGGAPVLSQTVSPGGSFNASDFDTTLGLLKTGDTVYVAFGANGNDAGDAFTMDFSIERQSFEERVADYRDDFRSGAPLASGWQYLWNAPSGWVAGGATGSLSTGVLGDTAAYRPLADAGASWTPDGNLDPMHVPDAGLQLDSTGGHPGLGAGQAGNGQDRYAIAAYTVSHSGFYALADSTLSLALQAGGDGAQVVVHVNRNAPVLDKVVAPLSSATNFDIGLGFLKKGDTVYVAFGANGNDTLDAFNTDFTLVRIVPRPEPLRNLPVADVLPVTAFGAAPNDTGDDTRAIQLALDTAKVWQQTIRRPVEVRFAPGEYRLGIRYAASFPEALFLTGAHDIVINGNGANLLITDPTLGLLLATSSSNIIIQNLSIDYQKLPFTQGTIVSVDGTTTFTLDLSPGFPTPTEPHFTNSSPRFGYAIDPAVAGRIREGSVVNYDTRSISPLGGSRYRFTVGSTTGLKAGDRYVELARDNDAHLIYYSDVRHLSVIGVTAYAGAGGFVVGVGGPVNVIDSQVLIKPGRWKSTNADSVHVQAGRVGAWIEGSTFEGQSDDAANFYSLPFVVKDPSSDNRTFRLAVLNGGTTSSFSDAQVRVGERLSFFDPQTGQILGRARVTNVDLLAQTVTLSKRITGVRVGTTKDATTVYNTDLSSSAVVQDTTFRNSRRYGINLKASNVMVVDSSFEGLSDQAVAVQNDPEWPEGLLSDNVLIQNNIFRRNGFSYNYLNTDTAAAVSVALRKLPGRWVDAPVYAHRNIYLLDNTFYEWRRAAITARNARGVEVRGNVIHPPVANSTQDTALDFRYVDYLELEGNTIGKLASGDRETYLYNVRLA